MKQKETRTKERNFGDGWFGVVKRRRKRWEGDGGWEGSVRRSKCRRRRWLVQAQGKAR
jgi:hypothetical protein